MDKGQYYMNVVDNKIYNRGTEIGFIADEFICCEIVEFLNGNTDDPDIQEIIEIMDNVGLSSSDIKSLIDANTKCNVLKDNIELLKTKFSDLLALSIPNNIVDKINDIIEIIDKIDQVKVAGRKKRRKTISPIQRR